MEEPQIHVLPRSQLPWHSAEEIPGLTGPDHDQLHAYPGPGRRLSAALARTLLRAVLGRALGLPPGRVPLVREPSGRTRLDSPAGRPRFGVSHDRGTLAVVVHHADCGIDTEDHPESEFRSVAHRFCAPYEARPDLGPAPLRSLWTAKESVAKALGRGLAADLRTVTFGARPGTGWADASWRGRPTGLLVHTIVVPHGLKGMGGTPMARTLSVALRADRPPALTVTEWTAAHRDPGAVLRPR